ncbi:MAG: AraC family transcriptional regulator [Spirochaetales bacterium]|nr:AraC family transcriptional regulator [Spirochaetales bacterium]
MRTNFVRWYAETAQSQDLEIRALGINESMNVNEIDRPSGTGDILLMFFDTPMTCGTPDALHKTTETSVILWSLGMGHYYSCESLPWSHSWIHFKGPKAQSLSAQLQLKPGIPRPCPFSILAPFLALIDDQMNRRSRDTEVIGALLSTAFRVLNQELGSDPRSHRHPAQEIRSYLEENYHRKISLSNLAQRLHYSESHLCTLYKKGFGRTIISDLRSIRMNAARNHLANRNYKVGEIATLVGVEDVYSFSKQFKKETGMSPMDYRKQAIDECIAQKSIE